MFKSIPANYYEVVLALTELDFPNIGNLSTPNLRECIGRRPYLTGNYTWNDLVSDLEQGNYKTLNNDECVAFARQNTQAGIKFMMMLTSDVSVKEGGNKSILMGDVLGGPNTNQYSIRGGGQAWAVPSGGYFPIPSIELLTVSGSDGDEVYVNALGTNCVQHVDRSLYSVDYRRIVIETDEICKLIYSPYISLVISLTLLVKSHIHNTRG